MDSVSLDFLRGVATGNYEQLLRSFRKISETTTTTTTTNSNTVCRVAPLILKYKSLQRWMSRKSQEYDGKLVSAEKTSMRITKQVMKRTQNNNSDDNYSFIPPNSLAENRINGFTSTFDDAFVSSSMVNCDKIFTKALQEKDVQLLTETIQQALSFCVRRGMYLPVLDMLLRCNKEGIDISGIEINKIPLFSRLKTLACSDDSYGMDILLPKSIEISKSASSCCSDSFMYILNENKLSRVVIASGFYAFVDKTETLKRTYSSVLFYPPIGLLLWQKQTNFVDVVDEETLSVVETLLLPEIANQFLGLVTNGKMFVGFTGNSGVPDHILLNSVHLYHIVPDAAKLKEVRKVIKEKQRKARIETEKPKEGNDEDVSEPVLETKKVSLETVPQKDKSKDDEIFSLANELLSKLPPRFATPEAETLATLFSVNYHRPLFAKHDVLQAYKLDSIRLYPNSVWFLSNVISFYSETREYGDGISVDIYTGYSCDARGSAPFAITTTGISIRLNESYSKKLSFETSKVYEDFGSIESDSLFDDLFDLKERNETVLKKGIVSLEKPKEDTDTFKPFYCLSPSCSSSSSSIPSSNNVVVDLLMEELFIHFTPFYFSLVSYDGSFPLANAFEEEFLGVDLKDFYFDKMFEVVELFVKEVNPSSPTLSSSLYRLILSLRIFHCFTRSLFETHYKVMFNYLERFIQLSKMIDTKINEIQNVIPVHYVDEINNVLPFIFSAMISVTFLSSSDLLRYVDFIFSKNDTKLCNWILETIPRLPMLFCSNWADGEPFHSFASFSPSPSPCESLHVDLIVKHVISSFFANVTKALENPQEDLSKNHKRCFEALATLFAGIMLDFNTLTTQTYSSDSVQQHFAHFYATFTYQHTKTLLSYLSKNIALIENNYEHFEKVSEYLFEYFDMFFAFFTTSCSLFAIDREIIELCDTVEQLVLLTKKIDEKKKEERVQKESEKKNEKVEEEEDQKETETKAEQPPSPTKRRCKEYFVTLYSKDDRKNVGDTTPVISYVQTQQQETTYRVVVHNSECEISLPSFSHSTSEYTVEKQANETFRFSARHEDGNMFAVYAEITFDVERVPFASYLQKNLVGLLNICLSSLNSCSVDNIISWKKIKKVDTNKTTSSPLSVSFMSDFLLRVDQAADVVGPEMNLRSIRDKVTQAFVQLHHIEVAGDIIAALTKGNHDINLEALLALSKQTKTSATASASTNIISKAVTTIKESTLATLLSSKTVPDFDKFVDFMKLFQGRREDATTLFKILQLCTNLEYLNIERRIDFLRIASLLLPLAITYCERNNCKQFVDCFDLSKFSIFQFILFPLCEKSEPFAKAFATKLDLSLLLQIDRNAKFPYLELCLYYRLIEHVPKPQPEVVLQALSVLAQLSWISSTQQQQLSLAKRDQFKGILTKVLRKLFSLFHDELFVNCFLSYLEKHLTKITSIIENEYDVNNDTNIRLPSSLFVQEEEGKQDDVPSGFLLFQQTLTLLDVLCSPDPFGIGSLVNNCIILDVLEVPLGYVRANLDKKETTGKKVEFPVKDWETEPLTSEVCPPLPFGELSNKIISSLSLLVLLSSDEAEKDDEKEMFLRSLSTRATEVLVSVCNSGNGSVEVTKKVFQNNAEQLFHLLHHVGVMFSPPAMPMVIREIEKRVFVNKNEPNNTVVCFRENSLVSDRQTFRVVGIYNTKMNVAQVNSNNQHKPYFLSKKGIVAFFKWKLSAATSAEDKAKYEQVVSLLNENQGEEIKANNGKGWKEVLLLKLKTEIDNKKKSAAEALLRNNSDSYNDYESNSDDNESSSGESLSDSFMDEIVGVTETPLRRNPYSRRRRSESSGSSSSSSTTEELEFPNDSNSDESGSGVRLRRSIEIVNNDEDENEAEIDFTELLTKDDDDNKSEKEKTVKKDKETQDNIEEQADFSDETFVNTVVLISIKEFKRLELSETLSLLSSFVSGFVIFDVDGKIEEQTLHLLVPESVTKPVLFTDRSLMKFRKNVAKKSEEYYVKKTDFTSMFSNTTEFYTKKYSFIFPQNDNENKQTDIEEKEIDQGGDEEKNTKVFFSRFRSGEVVPSVFSMETFAKLYDDLNTSSINNIANKHRRRKKNKEKPVEAQYKPFIESIYTLLTSSLNYDSYRTDNTQQMFHHQTTPISAVVNTSDNLVAFLNVLYKSYSLNLLRTILQHIPNVVISFVPRNVFSGIPFLLSCFIRSCSTIAALEAQALTLQNILPSLIDNSLLVPLVYHLSTLLLDKSTFSYQYYPILAALSHRLDTLPVQCLLPLFSGSLAASSHVKCTFSSFARISANIIKYCCDYYLETRQMLLPKHLFVDYSLHYLLDSYCNVAPASDVNTWAKIYVFITGINYIKSEIVMTAPSCLSYLMSKLIDKMGSDAAFTPFGKMIEKVSLYNSANELSHFGNSRHSSTLKVYCGRKYTQRSQCACSCCDGHCGPRDGCNCPECAKLGLAFALLFVSNYSLDRSHVSSDSEKEPETEESESDSSTDKKKKRNKKKKLALSGSEESEEKNFDETESGSGDDEEDEEEEEEDEDTVRDFLEIISQDESADPTLVAELQEKLERVKRKKEKSSEKKKKESKPKKEEEKEEKEEKKEEKEEKKGEKKEKTEGDIEKKRLDKEARHKIWEENRRKKFKFLDFVDAYFESTANFVEKANTPTSLLTSSSSSSSGAANSTANSATNSKKIDEELLQYLTTILPKKTPLAHVFTFCETTTKPAASLKLLKGMAKNELEARCLFLLKFSTIYNSNMFSNSIRIPVHLKHYLIGIDFKTFVVKQLRSNAKNNYTSSRRYVLDRMIATNEFADNSQTSATTTAAAAAATRQTPSPAPFLMGVEETPNISPPTSGATPPPLSVASSSSSPSSRQVILSRTLIGQIAAASANHRYTQTGETSWSVKFVGENSYDGGGLYRESVSSFCDEIMSGKSLFVFSPNYINNILDIEGSQDLLPVVPFRNNSYFPLQAGSKIATQEDIENKCYRFVGKLFNVAILTRSPLQIKISSFVWKALTKTPFDLNDLYSVDSLLLRSLDSMEDCAKDCLEKAKRQKKEITISDPEARARKEQEIDETVEEEFQFLFPQVPFTSKLPGGEVVDLNLLHLGKAAFPSVLDSSFVPVSVPQQFVTIANCSQYCSLVKYAQIHAFDKRLTSIVEGFGYTAQISALEVLSPKEASSLVCSTSEIDVDKLRSMATFPSSSVVDFFWEAMRGFTNEQRSAVLRFSTGYSQLPKTLRFCIVTRSGLSSNSLPEAHTCSFELVLPKYPSKEVLIEKLLFAATNCNAIDNDYERRSRNNNTWVFGTNDEIETVEEEIEEEIVELKEEKEDNENEKEKEKEVENENEPEEKEKEKE